MAAAAERGRVDARLVARLAGRAGWASVAGRARRRRHLVLAPPLKRDGRGDAGSCSSEG